MTLTNPPMDPRLHRDGSISLVCGYIGAMAICGRGPGATVHTGARLGAESFTCHRYVPGQWTAVPEYLAPVDQDPLPLEVPR